MKKFSDLKALTFVVWGLKTSLWQFGSKAGKGLIKALVKNTLSPIFTNKTSFSQES